MGNRIFVIALVIIGSITALAFHSSKSWNQQHAQPSSLDTRHPAQALAFDKLASLLAPHGVRVTKQTQSSAPKTDRHRQVEVHWETEIEPQQVFSSEPARAPAGSLSVKKLAVAAGVLPRLRGLELSSTQLLVIGVDSDTSLTWWHVFTDPRLLRAETLDSSGQLRSQVSYAALTDFVVAYPDDSAITELRFYQPEWTGQTFTLNLVGTLSVR